MEEAAERFNPLEKVRQLRGRGGDGAYLDVKYRLLWIQDDVDSGKFGPDASLSIESEPVQLSERHAIFRCVVTIGDANGRMLRRGVGHGSETATDFGDFIEKAETKARGRALEAIGYGTAGAENDPDNRPADGPIQGNQAQSQGQRRTPISPVDAGLIDPEPNDIPNQRRDPVAQAGGRPAGNQGNRFAALHKDIEDAFRRNGDGLRGATAHQVAHDLAVAKYPNVKSLTDLTDQQVAEMRASARNKDAAAMDGAWKWAKDQIARRTTPTPQR